VLLSAWDAIAAAADDDDAVLCWLLPSRAVAILERGNLVCQSEPLSTAALVFLIDRLLAKWAPSAESREENNPYLRLKCTRLKDDGAEISTGKSVLEVYSKICRK
jgi:hypothetical protein